MNKKKHQQTFFSLIAGSQLRVLIVYQEIVPFESPQGGVGRSHMRDCPEHAPSTPRARRTEIRTIFSQILLKVLPTETVLPESFRILKNL